MERKEAYPDIQEITKKRLFEVLDLLIKCGADKEEWLNQDFWGVSNKKREFAKEVSKVIFFMTMKMVMN